ncbi:MAG TPA: response regulator [Bacteroidia bacterium]|jgi:DNA-binding NtrC family response regulator|nr:response regulator [Bacteroidia bacterium]
METQGLNLFIVDDNVLTVTALKQYLQNRFGISINISTFNDGESCLERIDKETHVVILDYYMKGKNGLEVLKSIKDINPKTEVIMLSGNENMALAIESFRAGATDYIIKGSGSWKKITKLVTHIITEPIRLMVKEFRVSKYMAIFLLTFITLGIVCFSAYRMLK